MILVVLKAEDVYPVDELNADLFPVLAVAKIRIFLTEAN